MNEDAFNLSLRKFLKTFGVTAQREIEQAVRDALASGKLRGTEVLHARATIRIPEAGLDHDIDGEITLAG
jgi:hypothetical protein